MSQVVGDVEFHVHAADWIVHGHQQDARYNAVVLHVVFSLDESGISPIARMVLIFRSVVFRVFSGFQRLAVTASFSRTGTVALSHGNAAYLASAEIRHILLLAGQLRFEQKVDIFVEEVHYAYVFAG